VAGGADPAGKDGSSAAGVAKSIGKEAIKGAAQGAAAGGIGAAVGAAKGAAKATGKAAIKSRKGRVAIACTLLRGVDVDPAWVARPAWF